MSASELLNAVLQLPAEDRRQLIYEAWRSLDDFEPGDDAAFSQELEQRLDRVMVDPNGLCDEEDVLREARQLVGRKP